MQHPGRPAKSAIPAIRAVTLEIALWTCASILSGSGEEGSRGGQLLRDLSHLSGSHAEIGQIREQCLELSEERARRLQRAGRRHRCEPLRHAEDKIQAVQDRLRVCLYCG